MIELILIRNELMLIAGPLYSCSWLLARVLRWRRLFGWASRTLRGWLSAGAPTVPS